MRHHQTPFLNLFLVFGLLVQSFAPLWWIPRPATATAAFATPPARAPLSHTPTSNHFADINGDQRVDQHDLALLGQVWNCATGDACYTAALDFNIDGLIDLFDLASVGNEYDIEPPVVTITSPAANAVLTGPTITVQGTAADSHTIPQILVNGTAATLTPISGVVNFSAVITVTNGTLPLHVSAVDAIGQTSGQSRLVVIDGEGPFITVQEPPHRQAVYTVRPTVVLDFVDLATAVQPATAQITLTDESGTTADITSQLTINANGASGTLNFDLLMDESYTLTASVADSVGNVGTIATTFYVPQDPHTITPPITAEGAGYVAGIVADSTTCAGLQEYDPLACTGVAGARVTLELVDPDALALARETRTAELAAATTPFGLPSTASQAPAPFAQPISGTIITGPDGFFAFPVAHTGQYAVRVEKTGFTYGQRLTDIVLERSTPTTNIYLTPLDTAVTPCDDTGCQHTSADGQMQLDIPAGAIPNGATLDVQATQFDQVQYLPSGELPPGTAETYAFNLSGAAEITFTQPITVMVKNDRGFTANTFIPLGYWNQALLVWEHAGEAMVDSTGEWLVMQVTHFSNFDPNDPVSNATAAVTGENQTNTPGENCVSDCDSSQIELDSGALRQAFSLPTVNTLAGPMGVTMRYDSTRANPTAVIDIALNIEALTDAGLGEFDLLTAELFIEGQSTDQFSFQINELEQDGEIGRFRYFWDGRDALGRQLPPGLYFYAVRVKIPYEAEFFFSLNGRFGGPPDLTRPTGVTSIGFLDTFVTGTILLNSQPENSYGHGWQVDGLQRLYFNEDGSAMIDDGAHTQTSYLIPRFDLLPPQPLAVQTLDTRLAASTARGMANLVPHTADLKSESDTAVSTEQLTNPAPDPIVAPTSLAAPLLTPITSDIITDTVWDLAGSPYEVANDITIQAGAILTVEAGVVVNVNGTGVRSSIFVEGTLLATGTAGNPVIFTSEDDDNSPSWGGLVVQNGGHAALTHAEVRFGGDGPAALGRNASLAALDSTLILDHVLIFDSTNTTSTPDACLHLSNSHATLHAVTLDQCASPGNDDRGSLDIVGSGTVITATTPITITNSHHYALVTQWDLLDQIPTITTDGSGRDRIRILNSTIGGDLTISPIGTLDTLDFSQNVSIEASHTVTITAGMQIQAMGTQNNLDVLGTLITRGTLANPVIFTSDDNDPGNDGGAEWGRIFVNGGTADLDFTTIHYGGNIADATSTNRAVLAVNSGVLTLTNSLLFRNSDTSLLDDAFLYSENSTTLVQNSILTHDGLGNANPRRGINVVGDGGSFVMTDSVVEHRFNPFSAPLAHLGGIDQSNSFTTELATSRFELTGSTLTSDLTISPFSGLASYYYFGNLTVAGGSTLTVTAGTKLQAQNNVAAGLTINGRLVAQGTADQNVLFTSQSELGNKGEWGGIFIDGGTADLEFATIRFGGQRSIPTANANAALAVRDGELRLINSLLFQNGDTSGNDDAPLYIQNSTADIQGNTINEATASANPAYGLILVDGANTALTLEDNIINHPSRSVRSPLALLPHISATNHLVNDNNQRIVFTDGTIATPTTLAPVAGIAIFEYLLPLTVTSEWTIAAGTTVRSSFSNRGITVNGGSLIANGTADAPVTFEKQFAGVTTWPGITAQNGATIHLEHAHVRQAAVGLSLANSTAALLNSQFTENTIGVRFSTAPFPNLLARANDFEGNSTAAVQNISGVLVDMRFNYWGSPNGPVHPNNPGGDGETILGGANVLIDPFLRGSGALEGNTAVNLSPHDTSLLVFDPTISLFNRFYPDGRLVQFTAAGLHTLTRDRHGHEIRYSYNGDNALTTIGLVPNGESEALWTWVFGYSSLLSAASGQVSITDPAGRVTTLTLDDHGRLTTWQEPGLDAPMSFAYGPQHNMTHKTDARGNTTTYEYDEFGRITRSLLPPREVFDPTTGQFSTAQEIHDFAPSVVNAPLVNNLPTGTPDVPNAPLVTSGQIASTQAINGRLYTHTTNQFGAHTGYTDPLGNAIALERDERDRLVLAISAEGNCTRYSYDELDNLLSLTQEDSAACAGGSGLSRTAAYTYEPRFNQLKTITDVLGRVTTLVYDYEEGLGETGNLVKIIYPLVPNENGVVVTPEESYSYNIHGLMTELVDKLGLVTCFVHTTGDPSEAGTIFATGVTPVAGLLTQVVEDCGGALERTTSYTQFDTAGNAQRITEPFDGVQVRQTNLVYDERNRLIQLTDPLNSINQTSYDNGDNPVQIVVDVTGRPLTTTYRYNPLDQLLTQVREGEGERIETRLAYDLNRQLTLSQDGAGNVTTYQYDAANRLVETRDALGHTAVYSYDGDGRLTQLVDRRGTPTTFTYDGLNRLLSQTFDPAGLNLTSHASYDLADNILTSTDANGVINCLSYDDWNRPVEMTADCGGLNATASVRYNLLGMTTAETDPLGRTHSYGFDTLNRPTTMTDPLGQLFQTTYDLGGHVTAETDMLGRTTTHSYDLRHRRTATTDPLGGVYQYGYDSRNHLVSITDEVGRVSVMGYDVFGRLLQTSDATGATYQTRYNGNHQQVEQIDPHGRVTRSEYDALNRLVRYIDPLGGEYVTTYDPHGNPLTTSDPLGHTGQMAYDTADRLTSLTDPLGQTTQLGYDPAGNQTSIINPLGHTTQMGYDNLYRLVQLVNANGETTSYTHNLVGNLLTTTDPLGNVTTMSYDPLNRLLSQTNQSGNTRTFAYDAVGNQTSRTDGNGRVRTFTYDALNRQTSETWVGDGYTANYSYDPASQLTQASDPFASYSFAYDGAGRLTNRAETVTGLQALRMTSPAAVSFDLGYDEVGNLVALGEQINGQPTAATTALFDALNRPVRLTQEGAGVAEKRIEMGYDSASRLTQLTRFADVAGTQQVVNTSYGYDAENKLTSISHQPSGGPALNYSYSYDTADRLTQMTTPEGVSSFTYDEFDQLLTAVHSFQTDESYAYDDNGNRTNHTIGTDNRLLNDGTFSYTYDGEGNRTSKTHLTTNFVTEYSWDYRQRLTQVVHEDNLGNVLATVDYTYNVFDERIGRTDSTGLIQQFVVLGGSVQLVLDGDGEVTNRYLHGSMIDMVLVDEQVGGATLYPLADHQMTARHLLDGSGTVVNQRTFDSFGNLTGESNTAVDYLFGYTGREADELAEISYYRARYYDAQVGKFLSEDPIGMLAGDPNLTRYVGNNPTLVGDPSGLTDLAFFADGADAVAKAAKQAAEEAKYIADNTAEIAAENAKLKNMMAEMLAKRLGISPEDAAAQGKVLKDALLNEDALKAAKNAQKLADDIAMRAAREAAEKAATDPGLLSKMFGSFAAHAGSINVGFAVADYAEVAMHSVAEMYMAQARIMAHERVEAHRAEMERRQMEIHNERVRKHNEEVRQQLAQEQDARNREIEAERAQQIQQDALVIGQHLREQQFLEEQQRRRRGRPGPAAKDVQRALALHQAILLQKAERGDPQPTGLPPREPESNEKGMVGFFNELAEKHGTQSPFATTPANSQKKEDDCFPK